MDDLSRRDVLVGDRGYGCFAFLGCLQQQGVDFRSLTLIATHLDPKAGPVSEIQDIYRRRGRLEMSFDHVKSRLKTETLTARNFRDHP